MKPFNVLIVHPGCILAKRPITSLEDLQEAVGGYVQAINFGPHATAYVNEDGKASSQPPNDLATELCRQRGVGLLPDDFIVGPLVIAGLPNDEGDDTDVPEGVVQWVTAVTEEVTE